MSLVARVDTVLRHPALGALATPLPCCRAVRQNMAVLFGLMGSWRPVSALERPLERTQSLDDRGLRWRAVWFGRWKENKYLGKEGLRRTLVRATTHMRPRYLPYLRYVNVSPPPKHHFQHFTASSTADRPTAHLHLCFHRKRRENSRGQRRLYAIHVPAAPKSNEHGDTICCLPLPANTASSSRPSSRRV